MKKTFKDLPVGKKFYRTNSGWDEICIKTSKNSYATKENPGSEYEQRNLDEEVNDHWYEGWIEYGGEEESKY